MRTSNICTSDTFASYMCTSDIFRSYMHILQDHILLLDITHLHTFLPLLSLSYFLFLWPPLSLSPPFSPLTPSLYFVLFFPLSFSFFLKLTFCMRRAGLTPTKRVKKLKAIMSSCDSFPQPPLWHK